MSELTEQPTEQQYKNLQEGLENFFITTGNHRRVIHLFEDCIKLQREDTTIVAKGTETLPHGFYPICKPCLKDVRTRGGMFTKNLELREGNV